MCILMLVYEGLMQSQTLILITHSWLVFTFLQKPVEKDTSSISRRPDESETQVYCAII